MRKQQFLGSNINIIKSHNIKALLLTLLHTGQLSRVELAESIGLSTTTITNLTSELLSEGIITEQETSPEVWQRRVGRPRTMLRLIPDARYAVGVHIGIGSYRVAVTNLHAQIIESEKRTYDLATPASQVMEDIAETIKALIGKAGVERDLVLGVGVGASGLVDHERGVNVYAPRLQWRDVPIRDQLEPILTCPVIVENNVRSMALAESLFGLGRLVGSLAFVYGRIGVGAGFIVGGNIFRGSGAGAGEMGHTTILPESGETCTCGNTGCLETLVSEPALLRKTQDYLNRHPGSPLVKQLQETGKPLSAEAVFHAAREGEEGVRTIIEDQARYLGIALANLVNVMNPELILLGGIFAQGQDIILPIADKVMRQRSFGGLGEHVRLDITSFGWRAGPIGAASVALASTFYHEAVVA